MHAGWAHINMGKYRYEYMWKDTCTNTWTCTHTQMHCYRKEEFIKKRGKDEEHLCFGFSTCHHSNRLQVCKREERKNIIQRSLHSFRKVWSHQGAKNQLEMVIWKALQSSRQRPVRRSEMTLSSSLAGEGGWEGFKCPDSNNGHKGYLMWHSSPHWLRSLTWSVHIKKVSWDLKGALESSFFFSFLFSFLIQRDKVARSEHIACPKSSWKKVQNLGLNLGRWYPGSKLPAPPIRHLPSEHPPYQAELWFLKDLYKHATN